MTNVQMISDITVELISAHASDESVIRAAQASLTQGEWMMPSDLDPARFIRALMNPRHGVPFEHNIFLFQVEVPIFTARQWVKHRMSSMNEVSGRYTELQPRFYTAPAERPLVNIGTRMKPKFVADEDTWATAVGWDQTMANACWEAYQARLAAGIAPEYARNVLPLNIMTQFQWTVNARSLMNFLERRRNTPLHKVPTHPQWEIQLGAEKVEALFAEKMPLTHRAFVDNGYVAP